MPIEFHFKPTDDQLLLKSGLYHFENNDSDGKARIHLRIDPDQSGVLMVNASRVVHLNPTAAQMAYLVLQEIPSTKSINFFTKHFKVSKKQAKSDYETISYQLKEIMRDDGACPVCNLSLENALPFSARPTAPYRMDLAITYRCNNACSHCYNARPRNFPEMDTQSWKTILDIIWNLRIPHVVFTGGEPTLRDDLPELVAYAESKGLITGLNTNARRLSDQAYLNDMIKAGLDHVQITLESHDASIHDQMVCARGAWQDTVNGIRNVVRSSIYMMTNTTLLSHNSRSLGDTLEFLASEGVPTVGLNALIYSGRGKSVDSGLPETALPSLLTLARRLTAKNNQKLIWYTPTQYCQFNPIDLALGIKGCTAALYNMCIEPNGAVLPCQSYYEPLGNIILDSWESIWQHSIAVSLRERRDIPAACQTCDFLIECGGGCPLAREHQSIQPVHQEVFF